MRSCCHLTKLKRVVLSNIKEYKVLYTYIKVKTGVNYLAFVSVSTSTRQQLQLLSASAGGVGLLAKAWPLKPPKTPLPLRLTPITPIASA